MSICSVCGEPTQLHVLGKPICVKCENAKSEEHKVLQTALTHKWLASACPDGYMVDYFVPLKRDGQDEREFPFSPYYIPLPRAR
jgi:hypothetical protein